MRVDIVRICAQQQTQPFERFVRLVVLCGYERIAEAGHGIVPERLPRSVPPAVGVAPSLQVLGGLGKADAHALVMRKVRYCLRQHRFGGFQSPDLSEKGRGAEPASGLLGKSGPRVIPEFFRIRIGRKTCGDLGFQMQRPGLVGKGLKRSVREDVG